MKRYAAGPRWAARCCVLGRPDSAAIGPPCVLASHHPSHPVNEPSFCWSPLTNGGEIEARRVRRFERGDLFRALKRSRDVVEAFEQRLPLVRVEVEPDAQPV